MKKIISILIIGYSLNASSIPCNVNYKLFETDVEELELFIEHNQSLTQTCYLSKFAISSALTSKVHCKNDPKKLEVINDFLNNRGKQIQDYCKAKLGEY